MVREDARQNLSVHVKLGPDKFQFVCVAVVSNLLCLWDCLESGCSVSRDERRCVAVPPVSIRNDIRKNPGVANKFLVGNTR